MTTHLAIHIEYAVDNKNNIIIVFYGFSEVVPRFEIVSTRSNFKLILQVLR